MKKLSYFIIILVVGISCSKQQIVITEGQIPEDRFCYADAITPYTGKCIVLFEGSQKVKEEMFYKNGLLNGTWTSFYTDGTVKQKGEYRNGMFNGKWESWSELGSKLYEVNYVNDSLSGKYITWHKTGKLKEKGEYIANQKTGQWSLYSELGILVEKYTYTVK